MSKIDFVLEQLLWSQNRINVGLVLRFHLWWKSLSTWRRHSRAAWRENFPHSPTQCLDRIHMVYPVKWLSSKVTALPDFLIWLSSSKLHPVQHSLPVASWFLLSRPTFVSHPSVSSSEISSYACPPSLDFLHHLSLSNCFSQTVLNSHSLLAKKLLFFQFLLRSQSFLFLSFESIKWRDFVKNRLLPDPKRGS